MFDSSEFPASCNVQVSPLTADRQLSTSEGFIHLKWADSFICTMCAITVIHMIQIDKLFRSHIFKFKQGLNQLRHLEYGP